MVNFGKGCRLFSVKCKMYSVSAGAGALSRPQTRGEQQSACEITVSVWMCLVVLFCLWKYLAPLSD